MKEIRDTIQLFQKYGKEHVFDALMLAARRARGRAQDRARARAVRNIYKYYVTDKLAQQVEAERAKAIETLRGGKD
jgi:hypothetical protein